MPYQRLKIGSVVAIHYFARAFLRFRVPERELTECKGVTVKPDFMPCPRKEDTIRIVRSNIIIVCNVKGDSVNLDGNEQRRRGPTFPEWRKRKECIRNESDDHCIYRSQSLLHG
jgi:hypothetical protein